MRKRSVRGIGLQAVSRLLRVLSRERLLECLGFWRQTARSPHSHSPCVTSGQDHRVPQPRTGGWWRGVKEVACSSLASIFKRLFLARYLECREDLYILVDILHMTIRNRKHSGYCKGAECNKKTKGSGKRKHLGTPAATCALFPSCMGYIYLSVWGANGTRDGKNNRQSFLLAYVGVEYNSGNLDAITSHLKGASVFYAHLLDTRDWGHFGKRSWSLTSCAMFQSLRRCPEFMWKLYSTFHRFVPFSSKNAG